MPWKPFVANVFVPFCICTGDIRELIFRYVYSLAGVRKPVDRLWLSENTPAAIQKALAAMKPAQAYDALAQAAQARAQADCFIEKGCCSL